MNGVFVLLRNIISIMTQTLLERCYFQIKFNQIKMKQFLALDTLNVFNHPKIIINAHCTNDNKMLQETKWTLFFSYSL